MKTSSKNSAWAAVLAGLMFALVMVAQTASAQPTLDETVDATLIDPPTDGTFWLLSGITGDSLPPYPFNPYGADAPVYLLTSGELLVDDSAILISTDSFTTMSAPTFPPDDGGGGGTNDPPPAPDMRRNYEKFAAQTFSLLDTNEVCASDTNLCNAINSFPPNTNAYPTLQIKLYQGNSVIIRANHFDYSAETRDFALLISDKVETALWKSIDMLGSSDAQDGWLVQGSVPQYEVTDPMYMLVSNITSVGFFRAIPYSGPIVQLSGPQMNQTVSNTVSVTASIIDLSGMATSNQIATVDVSGYPIQYTLTTNNTINVDSRYAPNGPESINLTLSVWPVVFNPTNPPFNQQIEYDTTASLPLDFENAVALVGSGDYSSTEAPANYFTFEVAQPCQTTITIKDLSNNVVMTSSQYVASPSAVSFSWNYTQANGVTPYTNSSYQVAFTVNNPPNNLLFTNHLTYSGVRTASGVIITYAEEDPSTADGAYINGLSDQWIGQTLTYLYENIYDTFSLTQYYDYQIGSLRNLVSFKADAFAIPPTGWRDWLQNAFLGLYSDLTVAPAHGSSTAFGANRGEVVSAADCASWCQAVGSNWRMRKVALWTCFSGKNGVVTNNLGFASAFGIPSWAVQLGGYMKKNAGLFVEGDLTFGIRWAEIGEEFDQAWVCGPDQYPGGCDPTWAINWANVLLQNQYSQVKKVKPIIAGYKWLPYTGIYDVALTTNSISAINQIGGK